MTLFLIFTVVNHSQLAIKIMMAMEMETVPLSAQELGGTISV